MTLDSKILRVLFKNERLKPVTIRPSQGNVGNLLQLIFYIMCYYCIKFKPISQITLNYINIKLYIHLFNYEKILMIMVLILNIQINCDLRRRHIGCSFNVMLTYHLEQ